MIDLLIINSLAIIGVYYAAKDGMILSFLQRVPFALEKPVFSCPTCMSSVWSIYPFTLWMLNVPLHSWLYYPVYILSLAGLNTLVMRWSNSLLEDEHS